MLFIKIICICYKTAVDIMDMPQMKVCDHIYGVVIAP